MRVIASMLAVLAVLVLPSRRVALVGARPAASGTAVGRWAGRKPRRPRRRSASVDLLGAAGELLDLVSSALRAGLAPPQALELAVAELGEAHPVAGGLRGGSGPVSARWQELAERTGIDALGVVARAWRLSESWGAPLGESVAAAARTVAADASLRRRVDVVLAGPRATIRILVLLPVAGPVVALVFGIDPVRLYAGSAIGLGCLGGGTALLLLGRGWCARLVREVRSR